MHKNMRQDIAVFEHMWVKYYMKMGFVEQKVSGADANLRVRKMIFDMQKKNTRLSAARLKQRMKNFRLYVCYWDQALKRGKIKKTDPKINEKVIALAVQEMKKDQVLSPNAKIYLEESGLKKFVC